MLYNFQWLIGIFIFIPRSCTIVQQQPASSGSEKNSETTETQNVTEDVIDVKETKEDEVVLIEQKEVTEAQNQLAGETQIDKAQIDDKQEPATDVEKSAIESSEDKDDEIIQAIRLEDEAPEENKREEKSDVVQQSVVETNEDSAESVIQAVRVEDEESEEKKEEEKTETVPESVVETSEDSKELVIQAVRVADEPVGGEIEATQEVDTKSISSESSGLIFIICYGNTVSKIDQ